MREVFRSSWKVQPFQPLNFHMTMKAVAIGGSVLSQASLSQAQISNCPELKDVSAEHPYYIYMVNRIQCVVTGDKSLILRPGDFTIADSALVSTMTTEQPYTTIGLTVPAEVLRMHIPRPENVVGVRFSGSSGLSRNVSNMLISMWNMAEADILDEVGNKLITNLLEILSTCCYLHCDRNQQGKPALRLRHNQIKRLIDDELRNPDLSVGSVANQLGISSRYLQTLFAQENDTMTHYVRRRRLEGCKRQLSDPIWQDRSITEIAFSWGFNNAAHFSRAFKQQFGISAREYRKLH